MSHPRTDLRKAVCQALADAEIVDEGSVYDSRFLPLGREKLPAVLVFAVSEDVDDRTTAPRELERKLELVVEGLIEHQDGAGMSEALDDMALKIETAMHADPYFGEKAGDSHLTKVELGFGIEGAREIGSVQMTYQVIYHTLAPEPPADEDLDVFGRVTVERNLAQDAFTVRDDAPPPPDPPPDPPPEGP